MKIIFLFAIGLLTGFCYVNLTTADSSPPRPILDTHMSIYSFGQQVEEKVICTRKFPLTETCTKSIVHRDCKSDRLIERVTYAWRRWGDIDFILTVADESMWDENAVGDKVDGEYLAFGFCQVRVDKNKWGYDRYKAMGTWQERLAECHRMYKEWKDKGIVGKRLFGYNRRHANKLNISCK